jgi:hypothetical protein
MLSNILTIMNSVRKYNLEILIIVSIVFIILFGLYCRFSKKKGNWSSEYFYPNKLIQQYQENKDESYDTGITECKNFLEYIFNKPFIRMRYNQLELDLFNRDLNLACEYNSIKHYEVTYEHDINDLKNQIKEDQLKIDMCRKLDINLIIVPYYIPKNEISGFIYDELVKLKYF